MFLGPHKMKMSHYFSVFDTLWNLGLFWFPKTPSLILNFPNWNLGLFWFFEDPPLPKCQIPKFRCFFDWKASLSEIYIYLIKYTLKWSRCSNLFIVSTASAWPCIFPPQTPNFYCEKLLSCQTKLVPIVQAGSELQFWPCWEEGGILDWNYLWIH